jgi:hypothetical protein
VADNKRCSEGINDMLVVRVEDEAVDDLAYSN